MPISSTTRKAGPFIGNDVATTFPFAFKVFSTDDVVVVRADAIVQVALVQDSDYLVSLNEDQDDNPGGTVTLIDSTEDPAVPEPLASGYTLVIASGVEELQETDLTNQGGFYPEVITSALDRQTILVQQRGEQLARSLKVPLSESGIADLPVAGARAGKFLAFDADGNPLLRSDAPAAGTDVPFSLLSGKPTTLAGYGIADAVHKSGDETISGNKTFTGTINGVPDISKFGAVGDGTTDDTAAIQAAIDYSAANRVCVTFPAKTFRVGNLVMKTHACLRGAGPSFDSVPGGTVFKAKDGFTGTIITEDTSNFQYSMFLENLTIDGNSKSATGGISWGDPVAPLRGVFWTVLRNVMVSNIGGIGIYIAGGGTTVTLDNVVTEYTTNEGISMYGGYNHRLQNITAEFVGTADKAGVKLEGVQALVANGLYFEQTPVGLEMVNGAGNVINGVWMGPPALSGTYGIKVSGATSTQNVIAGAARVTGSGLKIQVASDVVSLSLVNPSYSSAEIEDNTTGNGKVSIHYGNILQAPRVQLGKTANVYITGDETSMYLKAAGSIYWGDGSKGGINATTGKGTFKGGLVVDNIAAPTVSANQVGFGSTTATTVGAAGGASALPATPTGYLIVNVGGTNYKIPYFAN